jgi:hypothetical protein
MLIRRRTGAKPVIVRDYGRDSVIVWANLVLAPLLALLGLRVGIRSEERLRAKIEADSTAMRRRGYFVASIETFSLPVIGAPSHVAYWYRVTYEMTSPPIQ